MLTQKIAVYFLHNLVYKCSANLTKASLSKPQLLKLRMAMKMCLAVALLVVATLTTTSFASPVQPITEAAGEEILPVKNDQYDDDSESINNEASIIRHPHDLEPIKNEASIAQQNCPVDLNIPAIIFNIRIRICSVTPTTCGLVRVRVGGVANILVQVCQPG